MATNGESEEHGCRTQVGRQLLTIIGLFLLVALAGCNAPADGTPTNSLSPAPATTTDAPATATDAPERIAPGVTTAGVAAPEVLAEAHRETLTDTSYTVSRRSTRFAANGSALGTNLDVARFDGTGEYIRDQTTTGNAPLYQLRYERISVWSDGETRFVLRVENGTRAYERQTATPTAPLSPLPRQYLVETLAGVEWTDVRAVPFGDTRDYYRLTGVRTDAGGAFETVTVLLDERGVIHRYRTEMTAERGSAIARQTVVVRYSALGTTSVESPAWVANARS